MMAKGKAHESGITTKMLDTLLIAGLIVMTVLVGIAAADGLAAIKEKNVCGSSSPIYDFITTDTVYTDGFFGNYSTPSEGRKIYIVEHRDTGINGTVLNDTSGEYVSVDYSSSANFGNILTWPTTLTPSRYDHIRNLNVTGRYYVWTDIPDPESNTENITDPMLPFNVTGLSAGISIAKTASPTVGTPGTDVTFTIDVTNTGDFILNPVKVVDTLPAGMSYVSDDSGGIESPVGTITWNDITGGQGLAPGTSTTITLVAHINAGASGTLTDIVTVTGTPPAGDDVTDTDSCTINIYTVGQGAPTEAIKNHFIDAYNRNGGINVLGNPTTAVHSAWGYLVQDFPGASGYAGGIIMYNPYKDYAYYIHGAIWDRYYNLGGPNAETDIEFELGPPVSDIEPYVHTLPPEVSSHGTQFRYQNFEGGALDLNVDTGTVFEVHGVIFAKWSELGYAAGDLGLVTSDEQEAVISAIGTEGRVSNFEGGHIHWHRNGPNANTAFETHGAIDVVYCSEGGSGGWLGFPVSDEYVNPSGYAQSDFEEGYITTTDGVNYEAYGKEDYTVGQNAPTEAIKNHFIDAYNRNGGITVLDNPTTAVHRAWGYLVQDFPGASGYGGGIIMYNPYKDYAYYIHGAIWERYYNLGGPNAKTDIEFELGPPVSDIEPYVHTLPPEVSSHGTQYRYQNFEGGALDLNVDTGAVFEIHGAIFAKWRALGYAAGDLGLVTSDEREAVISAIGTEGRVSDFEGGHIHWHRNGALANTAFETHGAIDVVYCSEGGSGGWLGFPVSDEYVNPSGYAQSNFEGGYITTTDGVSYEAFVYANNPPTNLAQFKSDSTTEIPVGGTTNERTVVFKGTVSDPDGDMVKLQVELRRLDEYGGQFDETKGGLKDSDFVASGSEAIAYAIELIDADYHWRARAVDEHGDSSEWQEFGGNDISEADFWVIHTHPSGTINVRIHGNVDDATKGWIYRTNYNALVFRRGVDNPTFILTLDGPLPSNYEYLYEIYSPNGANPIGSKRSSSFCCWDWTDINGNPLNKDQIPIGIYTVKGYLVNRNNSEDKKFIDSDEFYVIFDFDKSKESFVCWTQDYPYCKGCPTHFDFHLNSSEIWKRAVDNTSGSVTIIEAVDKISELARNIDGNMVYHHPLTDDETSVFGSDGYDNDFDGEIDEGLIFKDENWNRNYMCEDGKAFYKSWESWEWKVWHKIPYPAKSAIWIDDKGNPVDKNNAAKIAHYYDNMVMIKRDFDPEDRIPRQHSLGVCDDYAMLTVGYLRAIGVPSRPVIGEGSKNKPKDFCHEWLQWYENGKWHHLDTDNIAHKITWEGSKYNALYYHSEQSVIIDHVWVRRDDMLPDVDEDPFDIAGEYNGNTAAHSLTTSETSDNKTVCNYEIINTPIFKPGENSTVKLNITNSANESKTVIVVVVLIPYLGPYRTPSLAYAESDKEITVAANSTVTEDFNLEVVGFTSPGDYNLTVYEVVNNNATLALTTATEVLAKYTITTEMPDNITYKQPFTFNVTLRNIVTAPIHNISVELDTHYYFNTTEPLEKEILALDAGENYTFTWSLTPIDYGDLRIDVIVYTSDAGSETKIAYISVLSTPKFWINAQVPEKVNKSDDFILNATIFNSGDIPSDSVTLNLTTPENVTVNRTSAELGLIEAHENKTCSFRISQNESRDFMIILNATALNVTATGYAFITISQVPISYFTYEPQNPVVNQPVTFNASNSTDPDGIITEYEWHFGDGNVTNTTEPIITHSYASTGDYTVNLTVTDDDGATNSTSKIITVTNLCGNVAPCPDCDGTVDMGDVILLLNNVSYPENPIYVLGNDWSGDCRCTGVRDMGDVILLLNNVSYPEVSKYALDCCD